MCVCTCTNEYFVSFQHGCHQCWRLHKRLHVQSGYRLTHGQCFLATTHETPQYLRGGRHLLSVWRSGIFKHFDSNIFTAILYLIRRARWSLVRGFTTVTRWFCEYKMLWKTQITIFAVGKHPQSNRERRSEQLRSQRWVGLDSDKTGPQRRLLPVLFGAISRCDHHTGYSS